MNFRSFYSTRVRWHLFFFIHSIILLLLLLLCTWLDDEKELEGERERDDALVDWDWRSGVGPFPFKSNQQNNRIASLGPSPRLQSHQQQQQHEMRSEKPRRLTTFASLIVYRRGKVAVRMSRFLFDYAIS